MTTTTTTTAVVALLVVLAIVWRRRQRWRRKPWLAKLRAEAASKIIEKERSELREPTKERKERPVEVRDVAVKRPKERRKRGKEPKSSRMTSKREVDNCPERVVPELSSSCPSRPQSPHRIPLPPSPLVCSQVIPPALVLSSPASPSSLGISTELTMTTPSTSPSLPEPTQKTETIRKLPAFPPSSPLPPILARKQPPLARRPTPTVSRKPSVIEPEFPVVKREDEGRKRKQSDVRKKGTPEATQIASLKGALEAARLREEEVVEERKAWQKRERDLQTQVNQLAHQLHALSIACGAYGYGYGGAEPPGQPTNVDQSMTPTPLPPLNTSLPITPNSMPLTPNTLSVPPNTQPTPNGLPIPNPALAPSTPTLGPSIYPMPFPPFPYMNSHVHGSPMPHGTAFPPHSPLPPHASPMAPHGTPMQPVPPHGSPMSSQGTPMPPHSPMNFGMIPMMSPPPQHAGPVSPQSPFVAHPWMAVRGASPMHMNAPGSSSMHAGAGGSMHPGAYVPPGGSPMHMGATSPMHMTGPGRPPFFTGSPRRSRSPYVPHARQGTPSTPSVGSVDDTGRRSVDGRSSIDGSGRRSVDSTDRPTPDRRPSLKREREPETESESSSDEDSDDDSVIFEDGSVTDSVNLSLLGESLPKVESPTKFDSSEIPFKFTPLSFDSIKRPLKFESAENVVMP